MIEPVQKTPDLGPEPWLRLGPRKGWDGKTESAKAYAAFQHYYLSDPAERSLRKSAEALGKHRSQMDRWNESFHWATRTDAWDRHQSQIRAAQYERERQKEAEDWARKRKEHRRKKLAVGEELTETGMKMTRQPFFSKELETTGADGKTVYKLKSSHHLQDTGARMAKLGLALADESIREGCASGVDVPEEDVYETVDYETGEGK